MIRVQHLSKQFNGISAVDDISFDIQEGEKLVLLGTSGCGKTTTIKMINRLIAPTSGLIEVNSTDVMKLQPEELRRSIGYVIQHIGLFPHYTIEENIAVLPQLLGWKKERIRQRTDEIISKLHLLPEHLQKYPSQLSGGQQQRVGLARALVADPPIILMDEPLGGLDPITRSNIREEFKNLEEIKSKTILMVTHDVSEAFDLGDRICLMDQGKIQQIGTGKELLFAPANDFVDNFFANQHFQLQLKTLTLGDVIQQSNDSIKLIEAKVFPSITSVFEALEWFTNAPKKINKIAVRNGENETYLSREELMAAFYATADKL